jgi:hypothetical protein
MKLKHYTLAALISCCMSLLSPSAFGASIINGDFETGDFTGWSQDIDGFLPCGCGNDFSIVEPAVGNSAARIEADFFDADFIALDEVWYDNTLYQDLNLSGLAGQELVLSFDWRFDGEVSSTDEALFFGLGDGSGDYYGADGNVGFLLEKYIYGSDTFSTTLDASFLNAIGWTIEFQVASGTDYAGSYALIDNVTIEAVTTPSIAVPEPSVLWLMSFGLLGLLGVTRRNPT